MAFFPGALTQQSLSTYTSTISEKGSIGYYDSDLLGTNYANQFLIIPYINSLNEYFKVSVENYLNISRNSFIEFSEESLDPDNNPVSTLVGTKYIQNNFSFIDDGILFDLLTSNQGDRIDLQDVDKTLIDVQEKKANLILNDNKFSVSFHPKYTNGTTSIVSESNYYLDINDVNLSLVSFSSSIVLDNEEINIIADNTIISGNLKLNGNLIANDDTDFIKSGSSNTITVTKNQNGSISLDSKILSINSYTTGNIVLTTTNITEGTRLYYTDDRAKTAAVVNTVSGSQTTQAPSVSSIKSYINSQLSSFATEVSNNFIPITQKAASNGVATLDSTGKIPSSQIPAIAITNTYVVLNNTERDELTVQEGDFVIVSQDNKTYVWSGSIWIEVKANGLVTSVNGQTGNVSLTTTNITEGTNQYFTSDRAKSSTIINSMSGSEENLAPSVLSIKSYLSSSINSYEFATISGSENLLNKTLTTPILLDPIISGSIDINSVNTNQPVIKLVANSLIDGTGILNVEGSEPDIVFNQVAGSGYNTFTFKREGVDKWAFGRNDSDNFYITRNDGVNGWVNDTLVIDRTNGDVYISSTTEVVDGIEAALFVEGGARFGLGVNIGGNLNVEGNLNFSSSSIVTLPDNITIPSGAISTTQNLGNNTTKIATTEFVQNAISNLSGSFTLDLNNDQILFVPNGQNITGSDSFTFKNIDNLPSKTLVVGTEPNFPLTVKTAITTNDSYNGTYTALLAQNTSTSSMASTNIYLKNDIANEIEGYAVFGLEGSNYNSNSDYLSEKANSLYIGNSHGHITLMPNFYQDPAGGATHITYDYGLKGISITNEGGISTDTIFNPTTQEYEYQTGNTDDILTSRGNNQSVIWKSKESILSGTNTLISNINNSVGLTTSGNYNQLTGSNYLTGSNSIVSGLIEIDSLIKSINDDINLIESNRIFANTYYVNDGTNDIQTVVDLIGSDQSNMILVSPGSYEGSTLIISNSNDLNIVGPSRATSSHMCELISRGMIISGSSTTRITISNINIEGAFTISGTQGRHYFKNIIFDSTVTIHEGTSNFIVFEDCSFSGAISIANTVSATIYFNRCNFNNQQITSNIANPTQVILTECSGIKTTQTNLVGLVFVGRTGFYDNTVSNYQTNSKYVYNLLTGATTTFTGDYSELRNLPTLVSSSAQLLDSSSLLRTSDKGIAGGIAPLDNAGKIDLSYIPSNVLTNVHSVADSAALQNLENIHTLVEGDIAVQTDNGSVWIWDGTQWLSISVGNGTVTSVNTKTGPSVTLTTDDISENVLSPTNLWFTSDRAKSSTIIDSMSGSESNFAPSVSSVKSYITSSLTNYVLSSNYTDTSVLNKIKNVDGTGSGLDADFLDGLNGSDYVQISTSQTITGNKTFSGTVSLGSSATATTQLSSDDSTKLATTAFVKNALLNVSMSNEQIEDIVAPMFISGTHSGISWSYNDNSGTLNSTVSLASTNLTDSNSLLRNTQLGEVNGIATLDMSGKLSASQIPASLGISNEMQTISTTSSVTLNSIFTLIRCTNTGSINVTLPDSSDVEGYRIEIKRCNSGIVNIGTSTNQIFLDSTTLTGNTNKLTLNKTGDVITLIAHSNGWDVVSRSRNIYLNKHFYTNGNLTIKTGDLLWYQNEDIKIEKIEARLQTAPQTSPVTLSIEKILGSNNAITELCQLQINSNLKYDSNEDEFELLDGDAIRISVLGIGSSSFPGSDLVVSFKYYQV